MPLCSYPFDSFFLNTNGEVKFCCASDVTLGNINEEPLEQILNNEKSNDIRAAMFKGEWHEKNCSYCKKIEAVGGNSQRKPPVIKVNTPEEFTLTNFDVRWTNTCNLSCVYCNSQFSSKWASLSKEEQSTPNKDAAEINVFDFITTNLSTIENINLLGGEPLLQKQNLKLLDLLPDKQYYVLTNLTNDVKTNLLAQKMISNPNVTWGVSFETIGDRFEYVRHGASWKVFEENLRIIYEQTGKKLNAHPVYFLFSSLRLIDYCDYVLNSEYFANVYWQCLTTPASLSIFDQHPEIKTIALQQLDECLEKYSGNPNVESLQSFRKNLLNIDKESSFVNFNSWTAGVEYKMLNKSTRSYDLWPELLRVYGEYT